MPAPSQYRRHLLGAVGTVLTGGALALVGAQPTWVQLSARAAGAAGSALGVDVPGSQAAPVIVPLGVLALAGSLGLVATRGAARRVIGGVLAVTGLVILVGVAAVLLGPRASVAAALRAQSVDPASVRSAAYSVDWVWCLLSAAGGAGVVAGGLRTAARSAPWPAMGARFEARAPAREGGTGRPGGPGADPWAALDRGEDPTLIDMAGTPPAAASRPPRSAGESAPPVVDRPAPGPPGHPGAGVPE